MKVDGLEPDWREQRNGIAQGCLLSSFSFPIAMICLIYDVGVDIKAEFGNIQSKVAFSRLLLYAEDTLIFESDPVIA